MEAKLVARALAGPVSPEDAYALGEVGERDLPELFAIASERRDRAFGAAMTFSPKVFVPLTNLCRNRCGYCAFRRSPGDPGERTMSPSELRELFDRARAEGCVEALFCLGDTPEAGFREYRALLRAWGYDRTVDYLRSAGALALEYGLLPHTNAGVLSKADMRRLKEVNVSLGLMLESASERLCEKGMPHHRAPDKRPLGRLRMTHEAGELEIPFTSGLLIGIGETRRERVEALLAIRALHREHGHVQEVIIQNFRAHADTEMAGAAEPGASEIAHAIALARLVLDDDVSLQAPPNLNEAYVALLIESGINDFGGISPVTPDFINPRHPWPHLDALAAACEREGFALVPRLPIYDSFIGRRGFLEPRLEEAVQGAKSRVARVSHVRELSRAAAPRPASHGEVSA